MAHANLVGNLRNIAEGEELLNHPLDDPTQLCPEEAPPSERTRAA
jgi:hypothetical protein